MSIIKFANGKNRGTRALQDGIKYILNPEKTSSNIIGGRGLTIPTAYQDMKTVQKLMGKEEGRSYIHFILSFDEAVYDWQLRQIAGECASYFKDNQSVWAVHDNTNNRHVHFILNAVNVRDGKKFSQSKTEMLQFREFVNGVLGKHGISPIGKKAVLEIQDDYFDYEDFFDEYDYEEDGYDLVSPFGLVDYDELEAIQQAEEGDRRMKQVIRFFRGQESCLPDEMSMWEAEEIYGAYCASEDREELRI